MAWGFGTLLYFVVGAILAIPYNYLAGWEPSAMPMLIAMMPVAAFIVYAFNMARKTMRRGTSMRIVKFVNGAFWCFICYSILPILGNGLSIVLKQAGSESAAKFVFVYRYESLLAVPWAFILGMAVYAAICVSLSRLSRRNAPPPPSAPSGGSGSDTSADASSDERPTTDHGVLHLVST